MGFAEFGEVGSRGEGTWTAVAREQVVYPAVEGDVAVVALRDGDDHVFGRHHVDILSVGPVGLSPAFVFELPHLISIVLTLCLGGHHLLDPPRWYELDSMLYASAEQQLTEARHAFGLHVESPTSTADTLGTFFPRSFVYAQRYEQPLL